MKMNSLQEDPAENHYLVSSAICVLDEIKEEMLK